MEVVDQISVSGRGCVLGIPFFHLADVSSITHYVYLL